MERIRGWRSQHWKPKPEQRECPPDVARMPAWVERGVLCRKQEAAELSGTWLGAGWIGLKVDVDKDNCPYLKGCLLLSVSSNNRRLSGQVTVCGEGGVGGGSDGGGVYRWSQASSQQFREQL